MKAALHVFVVLLLLGGCGGGEQQGPTPVSIRLVESVPVETTLGRDDIQDTRDTWLAMLRGAEQTLDIAQFYYANREGEALEDVLRAVIEAADRGVKVRVIGERKFYDTYPGTLDRLRAHARIDVRLFDISGLTAGGVHHAKYFIVDGRRVFVGSQNWDWRALRHINELGVAMTDIPVASAFTHIFNFDWALAGNRGVEEASAAAGTITTHFPIVIEDSLGRHEVTPVFSPRDLLPMGALWDETAIKELIGGARDSLKLQLLSYRSYPSLEDAMLQAAARGVRISVLVSDWSLAPAQQEDLRQLQRTENITVRFTHIPEYSGGFISYARVEHCKYLLADDARAWIGTSNWSRSYFHASRNAGIILHSPSLLSLLHAKYQQSWYGPYAVQFDPAQQYEARVRDDGSGK
jgi:phosphatidylserine/phosphatidylglycerophosphate/cardiolipin synthase-like enzyme